MKKAVKRAKLKSSSRRAGAKPKTKRPLKTRASPKPKKKAVSVARSKLKRVARKAVAAAVVAGGVAAIGTALNEFRPGKTKSEGACPDEPSQSDQGKSRD